MKKAFSHSFLITAISILIFAVSCRIPAYTVEEFHPRIREHPSPADKLFNRGYAYLVMRRLEESSEAFEQALALNPEDAESYFYLGLDYAMLGMIDRAHSAFDRAYSFRSDYGASNEQLSWVYRILGDKEREMAVLKKAIADNDPHPVYIRYQLGRMYLDAGHTDSTIVVFKEAILMDANSAGAYGIFYYLGAIYQSEKDIGNAIAMYKEQLKYPKFANIATAYSNLGTCYIAINDDPAALNAFSMAFEKNPEDSSLLFKMAVICMITGQNDRMAQLHDQLRLLDPGMADSLATMVWKQQGRAN
jgi:tetratricopeptide (TPR) repeat protein